jgi:hypothetical protein
MQTKLQELMVEFQTNPFAISRTLRELRNANIDQFPQWALQILARSNESSATRFLATLVPLSDDVLECIANPALFEEVQARRILRALRAVDPQTETKLLRQITASPGKVLPPAITDRILDLVDNVSDGPRLVPVLMQIYRTANPHLRARLARSIGKHHRNKDWLDDRMRDPDPRVRANAVEANWGHSDEQALNLFSRALRDPHHRVIGNGAVGFYLAADVRSLTVLSDLLSNEEAIFRSAGVWAAGQLCDARFYPRVAGLSDDTDIGVRRGVVVALAKLKRQLDARTEMPKLKLRLMKATRTPISDPGGDPENLVFQNHLFLEVKNASDAPIAGLKPLQFSIYENDAVILDYSVQERTKYPKPGAYDIYFTAKSDYQSPETGADMVHIRIVISLESGVGEQDSYTFFDSHADTNGKAEQPKPDPAETGWSVLRG